MRPDRQRRPLDRLAVGLSLVGIVAVLVPMGDDPRLQSVLNAMHLPGFALLALAWADALRARAWLLRRRLLAIAAGGLLLAIGTEGLQLVVPGRFADLGDVLRNAAGLALGLGVHVRWPGLMAAWFDGD